MTTRCPRHSRPLVRTHGGSLICFPCFFERMRKQRSERVSWVDKPEATIEKQRAYSKARYAKLKEAG
jgi:hypothetical protein